MAETPLDRVLRLSRAGETPLARVLRLARIPLPPGPVATAGGRKQVSVRQYQRTERGRVQAVRQHVQGHVFPGAPMQGVQPPAGPRRELAGALKPGNVILVDRLQYQVLSVKPYVPPQPGPNTTGTISGRSTGSKGTGVNTGGPPSTGSQGQGVNTKGAVDPQVALDASANSLRLPWNSPEIQVGLRQLSTGTQFTDLLVKALPVVVVR